MSAQNKSSLSKLHKLIEAKQVNTSDDDNIRKKEYVNDMPSSVRDRDENEIGMS